MTVIFYAHNFECQLSFVRINARNSKRKVFQLWVLLNFNWISILNSFVKFFVPQFVNSTLRCQKANYFSSFVTLSYPYLYLNPESFYYFSTSCIRFQWSFFDFHLKPFNVPLFLLNLFNELVGFTCICLYQCNNSLRYRSYLFW